MEATVEALYRNQGIVSMVSSKIRKITNNKNKLYLLIDELKSQLEENFSIVESSRELIVIKIDKRKNIDHIKDELNSVMQSVSSRLNIDYLYALELKTADAYAEIRLRRM